MSFFSTPDVFRRQLKKLKYVYLEPEEQDELGAAITEMGTIYGASKVCMKKKKTEKEEEEERRRKRRETTESDEAEEMEEEEVMEEKVEEEKASKNCDKKKKKKDKKENKEDKLVSDDEECIGLSPGLSKIMSNSLDFDERLAAWDGWRKTAGRKIKPHYEKYAELKV